MTVTHRRRPSPARLVLLFVAATWLATGAPVFAHAEFVSSQPEPNMRVAGPFEGPIGITFDEALKPSGSHAELLDPSGTKVADATILANHPEQMEFSLSTPLDAGEYEVRWTTRGQDDEIARGTFTFTVLEPPPPPTPAPTQTPEPSASAAPSVPPSTAPSPSPAPSADGTPVASSTDVLFPLIAAVVAIVVLGALLLRNRRARAR